MDVGTLNLFVLLITFKSYLIYLITIIYILELLNTTLYKSDKTV